MSDSNNNQPQQTAPGASAISRRGFVSAGAVSLAAIALGAAGGITLPAQAAYVRPPGFTSATTLAALCNRCQRCVQACPYAIVQPLSLGQSLIGVGTPAIFMKTGYCDFCMKCVEACPTGALCAGSPTDERIGVAKVIKDACVAWNWAGCTECSDACPVEGALTLDDFGRPEVHGDLCNGCGLCENICPAASLRAYNMGLPEKGIYVVSPDSAAAETKGTLSADEFRKLRFARKEVISHA